MRRLIVSPQDFSPASYPLYADTGTGADFAAPETRTRERYWLYSLLFALTLLTTTVVGASMQIDFARNLPFDVERAFMMYGWVWAHPAKGMRPAARYRKMRMDDSGAGKETNHTT